jgi:hypothetical protein
LQRTSIFWVHFDVVVLWRGGKVSPDECGAKDSVGRLKDSTRVQDRVVKDLITLLDGGCCRNSRLSFCSARIAFENDAQESEDLTI